MLDVTETIKVKAEGAEIRRGIYRDFPLTFEDDDGTVHRVTFDVVSVRRDGVPEPYHTNTNREGIRIYMGEESTFLPPGNYTYQLKYTTGRQIRFFPDHTELFWNVTGNDWSFPILEATSRIALPGGKAPVRWIAYTGYYGERGDDYEGKILGDNTLEVSTTRMLKPREGFSVVLEIPAGLVAPPSGTQGFWYWFLDNKRFAIGGLGFIGVLGFYLAAWNAVGRDPPKGTIIPLFHPPKGISPALAGYIDNWGWSEGGWRNFTAATLSLATKGLIVFNDSGAEHRPHPHRQAGADRRGQAAGGREGDLRLGRAARRQGHHRQEERRQPRLDLLDLQGADREGEPQPLLRAQPRLLRRRRRRSPSSRSRWSSSSAISARARSAS